MFDYGDMLLFALTAWRETSWSAFKKLFNELHRRRLQQLGAAGEAEGAAGHRGSVLRMFGTLAHVDVEFSERRQRVIVAPATLAALPIAGLSKAILCGGRSPSTAPALRDACTGTEVRLVIQSQKARSPYAPALMLLEAATPGDIEKAAQRLRVPYARIPPSWMIAEASASLHDYLRGVKWSSTPEVNWQREDFDPELIRFGTPRETSGIRLSRYQDPVRLQWRYFLRRDGMSAAVSSDWGRYAILAEVGRQVLDYDADNRQVFVPKGAPLPALLSRALTLCSGLVPRVMARRGLLDRPDSDGSMVYDSIPSSIYRVVCAKAGQPKQREA